MLLDLANFAPTHYVDRELPSSIVHELASKVYEVTRFPYIKNSEEIEFKVMIEGDEFIECADLYIRETNNSISKLYKFENPVHDVLRGYNLVYVYKETFLLMIC